MNVVFRVDASIAIGAGHVMRCLVVANQLSKCGWTCCFVCQKSSGEVVPALLHSGVNVVEIDAKTTDQKALLQSIYPEGVNLMVIDHYELDEKFEKIYQSFAKKIFVIDDLANRCHYTDLLLDQTYGRTKGDYDQLVPGGCQIIIGPKYALLRSEFAAKRYGSIKRRDNQKGKVRRVLISFGGNDQSNMTKLALEGIEESGIDVAVDVVLGAAAPHLATVWQQVARSLNSQMFSDYEDMAMLMSNADLSIGAGGMTSWERCCLGLPALTVTTATNQETINSSLNSCGAV